MANRRGETPLELARRLNLTPEATIGGRGYGLRPRSQWAFYTGDPYPDTPATADERAAMGLPPFGRGVALLANAIADTDWVAERWNPDAGVNVRLSDQPAFLRDPLANVGGTPWAYKWAVAEDGILYGNHFAALGGFDDRTARARYVIPINPTDVWIMTDPDNPLVYSYVVNGVEQSASDLIHIAFGNKSGEIMGRGVIDQYGEWLGGAIAAETHAGAYFEGGALPPAVLSSPTMLTQAQADDLKAKWNSLVSTREPVVLPAGYVLTPVVSDAEKAQLVQSRTWNSEAVAMMLGIPPYKLGLPGPTMTYQNVETADIDFIRDSVTRYASPIAQAISKWLMPNGTFCRFDYGSRMRADQRTTAEVLSAYVGAGILTHDEARAAIGRAPLAGTAQENETPAGVPELTPETLGGPIENG